MIKSVLITARRERSQTIDYILSPNTEFSSGKWFICVNSVSYNCAEANVDLICNVTCNFSRSEKYSIEQNQVTTYEQPFGQFHLTTGKKVVSLSKIST
jgi:hypothetical protein